MATKHVPSFDHLLAMHSRASYAVGPSVVYTLDDKITTYRFADSLGVKRPEVLAENVPLEQVPLNSACVLKPKVGVLSKNVFKIIDDEATELTTNRAMPIEEMLQVLRERITSNKVKDAWIVEGLVTDPETGGIPRDFKFYGFYGAIPLVLETIREPEVRRCWYDGDGNLEHTTGVFDSSFFEGSGVPDGMMDLAQRISREIPAPFIRIDFLRGSEPYLNEFTPRPGGLWEFTRR